MDVLQNKDIPGNNIIRFHVRFEPEVDLPSGSENLLLNDFVLSEFIFANAELAPTETFG